VNLEKGEILQITKISNHRLGSRLRSPAHREGEWNRGEGGYLRPSGRKPGFHRKESGRGANPHCRRVFWKGLSGTAKEERVLRT